MTGIKDYSTTAASNTMYFPENIAPNLINDNLRQVQADIRNWYEQAEWLDLGFIPTYVSTTSFTVSGDKTAYYTVGRKIKIEDATTLYGVITASSYTSPNTTVTVSLDSGSLSVSISSALPNIIKLASQSINLNNLALTGTTSLVNATFSGLATFADIKVVDSINDTNNNEVIKIVATTSAVNEITITNAATGSGASIAATGTDTNIDLNLVSKGSGYVKANGSILGLAPKQIIISNNVTDANNDIDFAAGNFPFSDGTGIAALSAITKRLDAAWAVGTNQGGLDTGSKANSTWYHCYAIYNPTTLVSDAIFSTSATSPTLPSGYTKFKRVGSILTNGSGNILAFTQAGNFFNWTTVIASISAASQTAGSETLRALATPLGIKTKAIINFYGAASSAGAVNVKAYSADISSATLAVTDGQLYVVNGVTNGLAYVEAITNTSSQIKTNSVNTSGTPTLAITITVSGWQDITL